MLVIASTEDSLPLYTVLPMDHCILRWNVIDNLQGTAQVMRVLTQYPYELKGQC